MSKRTNEKYIVDYLVGTDQGLPAGSTLVTTTSAMGVANNQLAVVTVDGNNALGLDPGVFLKGNSGGAGPATAQEVPAIRVVRGTPASPDVSQNHGWFNEDKAFQGSGILRQDKILSWTAKLPKSPVYSSEYFTGFPTTVPGNAEYTAFIEFRSVRRDRDYGGNVEMVPVNVRTPDFTAVTVADQRHYLLANTAIQANLQSKIYNNPQRRGNRDFVVLGIAATGATGVVVSAVNEGTTIPVFTLGGQTYSLGGSYNLTQALNEAIGNSSLLATDVIVNVTDTEVATGAELVGLLFVGISEERAAALDRVYRTNTRVEAQLGRTFQSIPFTKEIASGAFEGSGLGLLLDIDYDERAFGFQGTMQLAGHSDELLTPPRYIDPSAVYTQYICDYYDDEPTITIEPRYQKRLILLVPGQFATTNPLDGTPASGVIGSTDAASITDVSLATTDSLANVLGGWITSNGGVELLGDATGAVPFP